MRWLLTALLTGACVAQGFELKRDSTGEPAAWKSPVHFIVDDHLAIRLKAEGAQDAVQTALKTVGDAIPSLSLSATAGKTRGVGYDFDHPEESKSEVVAPEDWKWNVGAVATTVITLSRATHQILEADIAFNVKHTGFAVVVPGQPTVNYDVQNAMTHELGHALGLAHNALRDTVMYPSSTPGEISKRALAADDLEGLRFLYGAPAVVAEEAVQGCSTAGSAPFALAALMMGALLRRRALVAVFAAVIFVAPLFASARAAPLAWTVMSVTTFAPSAGPAVLESEVTFVRGGQLHSVRVPGGRWGDLEQVVEGVVVPLVGETFLSP